MSNMFCSVDNDAGSLLPCGKHPFSAAAGRDSTGSAACSGRACLVACANRQQGSGNEEGGPRSTE